MGLRLALKYHSQNNLDKAEIEYKRALDQGVQEIVLFQNYGSLLRAKGKIKESRLIYQHGLKLFPNCLSILTNQANLELKERPSVALMQYLYVLRRRIMLRDAPELLQQSMLDLIQCMTELGLVLLPYQFLVKYKDLVTLNYKLTLCLLQFLHHPELTSFLDEDSGQLGFICKKLESQVSEFAPEEQVELRFALAASLSHQLLHDQAFEQYNLGRSVANRCFDQLNDESKANLTRAFNTYSWNFSNILLKNQNFLDGWTLYDHGLVTPTNTNQRWQRALSKPFSENELPLWRGESLITKSILLLEEQGIGDTMQFISLVPHLFSFCKHVGLFLSQRLYNIYVHAFELDIQAGRLSVHRAEDAISGKFGPSNYDVQLPIASLCQYLFTHPNCYHPRVPILKTNSVRSVELHDEYLSSFPGARRVIGISWRGGGTSSRIKMKSIDEKLFLNLISNHPDVVFVSLQYGEAGQTINSWKRLIPTLNIIHDQRFNPLKDMQSWLIQVNACDSVISVANTTIHGSGGLNIPTYCLLSRHADWRWLSNPLVRRSYWYPSVGIARQNMHSGSWHEALEETNSWIRNSCPMPVGIDHV